jgi:outer membrane protein assembly factor BamB
MQSTKLFSALTPSQHFLLSAATILVLSALSAGQPSITTSPGVGPPTTTVHISGQGFEANAAVDIYFDTRDEALVITDGSGAFAKIAIPVPAKATPGNHFISAVERNTGTGAQKNFLVRTDWPQFGFSPDGTRNNIYENVLSPSTVGGLTLDWSYPASPISEAVVAGGFAYTGSGTTLYGLNANTGKMVWNYYTDESPAFGTFAVANNLLFSGTNDLYLWVTDAKTGAWVWDSGDGNTGWDPPNVVDGVVYLVSDNLMGIYAYNAATGALEWTFPFTNLPSSSPAVVNGIVYAGADHAYALSGGIKLWSYASATSQFFTSPAVSNGVVYIGASDNNLYALSAADGSRLWDSPVGGVNESPAVDNQKVFVSSEDGHVYALDANTGAHLWKFNTGGEIYSSPAVANGVVYATSFKNGTVYALNANTGALLWSYVTGNVIQGSPLVANGILYVTNIGVLDAFHLPSASSTPQRPDLKELQPDLNLKVSVPVETPVGTND